MPKDDVGLTRKEAAARSKRFGPNALPEKPPPSNFSILASQLKSPLVYVLVVAGLVTFSLGHRADTVILFAGVVLNTILGFFQEKKASNALYSLRKLVHPEAVVIRDGAREKIDVTQVVPGDICVLNKGDKVPADGRVSFANRLFVDESMLTGESVPVSKTEKDGISMGTIITSGQAKMVVEKIGKETQIGAIASQVQEFDIETPLRRQLKTFSKQLSIIVVLLVFFVFIIGLISGKDLVDILTAAVALAVSAIPEGLLVSLTVVLAIGMQRILKREGLVRNLMSAETLGGVTTICIDKTGTITQGKMQVVDVIGSRRNLAKQGFLANDLEDPMTIAVDVWAKDELKNIHLSADNLKKNHTRLDSIPFSSKDRYFVSLNDWGSKGNMLFVNGAPEYLIKLSKLSNEEKKEIKTQFELLTKQGKRVIGYARKVVSDERVEKKLIKDLEWVGLIAYEDPVREGVKEAFEKTKNAGIKTIVITGDYIDTAVAVMNSINLEVERSQIITGDEINKLIDVDIARMLKNKDGVKLFARTTPDQKLIIVNALKKNGEVVAMMGDGVNDAPAINKADIGIVVGEATDVAKETADLVLLDSNYSTILAAIEEGRGIFDNIRKIVLYLLSDAFEEIIIVVGALLLGLPLPVTAAQILWINLISDGFPDLALTVEPKVEGIMDNSPREPNESIVTSWMKLLIILISLTGGLIALALFIYYYQTTNDLILSRSVAFAALGVNSLVFVFSVRTLKEPFWRENPFSNKWLNLAVVGGLILQFLPFCIDGLGDFIGVTNPVYKAIVNIFLGSLITFIMIEITKSVIKKHTIWFTH